MNIIRFNISLAADQQNMLIIRQKIQQQERKKSKNKLNNKLLYIQ